MILICPKLMVSSSCSCSRWEIKVVSFLIHLCFLITLNALASSQCGSQICPPCCSLLMLFSVWADYVEGRCPVKLTSVRSRDLWGMYFECVKVRVWMKADGTESNPCCKSPFCYLAFHHHLKLSLWHVWQNAAFFQTSLRPRRLKFSPQLVR